jgi:hypothetical protein
MRRPREHRTELVASRRSSPSQTTIEPPGSILGSRSPAAMSRAAWKTGPTRRIAATDGGRISMQQDHILAVGDTGFEPVTSAV